LKLLRYGPPGLERPGLLDAAGAIRDLSGLLADIGPDTLSPATLQALAALDPRRLPVVEGAPRLGTPWRGIGKFVAVGLNYGRHAAEAGMLRTPCGRGRHGHSGRTHAVLQMDQLRFGP